MLRGLFANVRTALRGMWLGMTSPVKRPLAADIPPATNTEYVYASGRDSRKYLLYVPSSYRGQPVPLIVMLHGCSQDPQDFSQGTRMNEAADNDGFIVAYPAQPRVANIAKCWNWFNPDDQERDAGEPALIAGITREVMTSHAIDPTRVYIAGLSAGGAMAAIMARAYPDLYAAIGVHSGLAYGSANNVTSALAVMKGRASIPILPMDELPVGRLAVPLIAFQGDSDNTVHPQNIERLMADVVSPELATEVAGQAEGLSYTQTVYRDNRKRVLAEQWLVHGGGHAWFGGSPAGSYTEPQGPDATREMIRFFLAHPRKAQAAA